MDRTAMRGAGPCVAVLGLALALGIVAPAAQAGIGDRLKKKLEDKAGQKAGEEADRATGGADAAKSAGSDAAAAKPAAAGDGGKVSAVSTKFDFVPGDRVLFEDDFTRDELGEFPARWRLQAGTFEVAELDGERWLRCVSVDGLVRMKVPPGLPEYWTLEFDAMQLEGNGSSLTVRGLTAGGGAVWEVAFPVGERNLTFRSGDIFSTTPLEGGAAAGRHRVMFMARGPALKVYLDRERLASVPDVTANGVAAEIEIRLWAPSKPMITAVRFAEGCKPAPDLLDGGKLVTYGIRFATGSDVVQPESAPVLRQVAAWLEKNGAARLRITGHTDNVGKPADNLDLSRRRAAAVAKVLSGEFQVAAGRLDTDGQGDTQAVTSNATPEGRAMNRRVEFARL